MTRKPGIILILIVMICLSGVLPALSYIYLDYNSSSPLINAIKKGHLKTAARLIYRGADVNEFDNKHWTPLIIASYKGYTDIVRLLIKKGADVTLDSYQNTALHYAKTPAIAKLLLDNGADLHALTKNGLTPLHRAVGGREKVAVYLIGRGANVRMISKYGIRPMHWVSSISMAKALIINGAEVHVKSKGGFTPLHSAANGNRVKVAGFFIEKGIDINVKTDLGQTPLHYATKNGRDKMVKFLISKGAKVNAKDIAGNTPYAWAVRGQKRKTIGRIDYRGIIRMLKKHGGKQFVPFVDPVYVKLANRKDGSAGNLDDQFIQSATWGNLERMKYLHRRGANINFTNFSGETALIMAVRKQKYDMAKYLLENGADVNAKDRLGNTSLLIAIMYRSSDTMTKMIIDNKADLNVTGGSGNTALLEAIYRNRKMARYLIKKGADVNLMNTQNVTPLIMALKENDTGLAKMLLDKGADVKMKDNHGRTALINAIINDYESPMMVKYLIDAGADVNAKDNSTYTPLMWAAIKNRGKTLQLLINCGADLTIKDKRGRTALKHAEKFSNHRAVSILRDALKESKNSGG
jgi:ankyrin repeat protein